LLADGASRTAKIFSEILQVKFYKAGTFEYFSFFDEFEEMNRHEQDF